MLTLVAKLVDVIVICYRSLTQNKEKIISLT
jgi:hypothetical protein